MELRSVDCSKFEGSTAPLSATLTFSSLNHIDYDEFEERPVHVVTTCRDNDINLAGFSSTAGCV